MDLGKIRKGSQVNARLKELKCRKKLLCFNIETPSRILTKDEVFQESMQKILNGTVGEYDQKEVFKTKEDEQLERKLQNNRLYKYFLEKNSEILYDKLDQRITQETKAMNRILISSENKLHKKRSKIRAEQNQLSRLYQELHFIYENLRNKDSQNSARKKINWMKQVIENKQDLVEQLKQDYQEFKLEVMGFLKLLIKNGHTHSQGVCFLVKYLEKVGYFLKKEDLPDFMDAKSFECIRRIINEIKEEGSQESSIRSTNMQLPKLKKNRSRKNQREFDNILSHRNLNQVYSESKQYIRSWLEKKSRSKSLVIYTAKNCTNEDAKKSQIEKQVQKIKERERKRLSKIHPRQVYIKICGFMFGNIRVAYGKYYKSVKFITGN